MAAGNLWVNLGLRSAAFDRGLKKSRGQIKGFGGQVKSLNSTLRTFGAALGVTVGFHALKSGLTSSVRQFASFEKSMAQVSTMLTDQTMKFMPQYEKQIRAMSMEMGESTETLSRGLYDILSASVDASKAMKVLGVAARAAKGGITDTAVAADAITTILKSYNMAAEKSSEISDKMFATIKSGKLVFGDYAANIGKVASLAAIAGVSFEDLNATIATLTTAGVQTEIAMTGVRGVITSLIAPSDEAKAAAAEFGLVLDENTLRTVGLVGMFDKLRNATVKQLAAIIPNVRALAGFSAGVQNSVGAQQKLVEQYESAGKAQEALQKIMNTTSTELDIAKAKWDDLSVEIGESFAPHLERVIKLMEWINRSGLPGMATGLDNVMKTLGIMAPTVQATFKDHRDSWGSVIDQIEGGKKPRSARTPLSELRGKGLMSAEQRRSSTKDFKESQAVADADLLAQKEQFNDHSAMLDRRRIDNQLDAMDEAHRKTVEANAKAAELTASKWQAVSQVMEYSMTGAFDRIIWEAEKWQDAVVSILRDVAREMTRVMISQPLTNSIMAAFGQNTIGAPAAIPVSEVGGFGNSLPGNAYAADGGIVERTGLAMIHKGETYSGVDGQYGRGNTVNVVIENNSGTPLQQEGPARFEADQYIVSVVSQNIQNRGTLYQQTRV